MDFGDAMKWMRRGKRLTRFAWKNERMNIYIHGEDFVFSACFFNAKDFPSKEDVLSNDWSVIYQDLGACREKYSVNE